jgi:hypothetical protein
MKKHNYPTLTNYLAKTKNNADLYRLYNPQFSYHTTGDVLLRHMDWFEAAGQRSAPCQKRTFKNL